MLPVTLIGWFIACPAVTVRGCGCRIPVLDYITARFTVSYRAPYAVAGCCRGSSCRGLPPYRVTRYAGHAGLVYYTAHCGSPCELPRPGLPHTTQVTNCSSAHWITHTRSSAFVLPLPRLVAHWLLPRFHAFNLRALRCRLTRVAHYPRGCYALRSAHAHQHALRSLVGCTPHWFTVTNTARSVNTHTPVAVAARLPRAARLRTRVTARLLPRCRYSRTPHTYRAFALQVGHVACISSGSVV